MVSVHVDTARTWRGGQNQVMLTVRGLRARGCRAALVAHPRGELRKRMSGAPDVFPLAPRAEIDFHAAWKLARLLRRLDPEVVHAHDAHAVAMTALALSLAGAALRTRFAAARRVDFRLGSNAFSRWKHRQVERFLCASACIRSILIAGGVPPDRATVVHEGVDVDRIAAAPALDVRREFRLPARAPVVGNVAALVPHKGQRYLIEAAARVVRAVPEARFVIAGEGELEAALRRRIVRLGLREHVVLAGFRPDVIGLHKGFDLFVMSSTTEGLGTSALDAMACGRAVVATRAGGLPEVVVDGDTGLLAPVRDPAGLADAIIRLLRDPRFRADCGRAGLERARRVFNVERMLDETVRAYEDLAGTGRAGDTAHPAAGG